MMQVQIGQKLNVTVTSVEVYGLWCQWQDYLVLIPIPETSWIAAYNSCLQFASIGDNYNVIVRRVDHQGNKIGASIRELYPNPWGQNALAKGSLHRARIVRHVTQADRCGGAAAYLVELLPGAYAMLCGEHLSLQKDDYCSVIVTESDAEKRAITLALYNAHEG